MHNETEKVIKTKTIRYFQKKATDKKEQSHMKLINKGASMRKWQAVTQYYTKNTYTSYYIPRDISTNI